MQSKVTDEMIARYMSGQATPDEDAAVLDYLAESDEHLDDFLAMSASVEQFGNDEKKTEKRVRPLWPALSAAASVALLIGVGFALWNNSQTGSNIGIDAAPSYAEQSVIDTAEQDSIISMRKEEVL